MRIAINGAGLAGLACGTSLPGACHAVSLFDEGCGAGGRMSSRRIATDAGEAGFRHEREQRQRRLMPRGVAKSDRPQTLCVCCGRSFGWRRKWARD